MKVIKTSNLFRTVGDDITTYDKLPLGTYNILFNPMEGYALSKTNDLTTNEEKVYGNHDKTINKVFNAYQSMTRSLGILLSGDKGIGKSLFTRMVSEKANSLGLPVIIVGSSTPGLANFLLQFDQQVVVVFDEFEKNFDIEAQEKLLSLFDGLNVSKHMYLLTINNLSKLSQFFINRTGRVHYHVRFQYPTTNEIKLYLEDKVVKKYHKNITEVLQLSMRMDLNYDLLRAIAFELNSGLTLREALPDLNVSNQNNSYNNYNVEVKFKNGVPALNSRESVSIDMSSEITNLDIYFARYYPIENLDLDIKGTDMTISKDRSSLVVTNEAIERIRNHTKDPILKGNTRLIFYTSSDPFNEFISSYLNNTPLTYSPIPEALQPKIAKLIDIKLSEKGGKKELKARKVSAISDELVKTVREFYMENLESIKLVPASTYKANVIL